MFCRLLRAALLVAVPACLLTSDSFNTRTPSVARAQTSEPPTLALGTPVGGFTQPVAIAHAGDGSNRIFVVEKAGRIRIVKSGVVQPSPFLDIAGRVGAAGFEEGLLGLAFPPDYARKGYFYVYYTNTSGDLVIARYRISAGDVDVADVGSEQIIITIPHPGQSNHNGGQLAFGPIDKMLYVGTGDGGGSGDQPNNAQNTNVLLGKMLRIDTESGRPYTYTSPPSNPFVSAAGFRPEIWATGLRNPWRYSFDRTTFDLFIADVGQGAWEEIDYQPASSDGGENYGWRIMEGNHCFNPNPCSATGLILPVVEYDHSGGNCSVTGGYVYRAATFPRMRGLYFYGDFCSGRIWSLRREPTFQNNLLLDTTIQISSFGEDEAGNLYVASFGTGQIFPLVDNGSALPPVVAPTPEVRFGAPSFAYGEGVGVASVPVVRSGDTSVDIYVDYATGDGTASSRKDYTAARGTLHFAPGETLKGFNLIVTNDETDEPDETLTLTLSNFVGARGQIEAAPGRTVTIQDDDAATNPNNPIDRSDFFVTQHYHDFFSRGPDAEGLAFWVGGIESCGANAGCREVKRIDTSAAFFLSIEFQETGYLVYLMHKAAFGDVPGTPVPVRLGDFLRDTQEIGRGVVVNQGDWRAQLEANKRAFANAFVDRPAFVNLYPTGQTPTQYVNALNTNAGLVLTPAEVADLAARLADGRETRASALRRVAEDADFRAAEFNKAFVLMQYFGYLRRDPDAAPNTDFEGYNFWLGKLNDFGGDYRRAEMVKAFLDSIEYRQRFR